ncbi:MAG: flagellar motor switch protein FliN [Desulfovibrio sp.]|nr:MAG: flagellar motor switch protein FliN [Desulfovibrio sp.]
MGNEMDQDQLAEEWAAALSEDGEETPDEPLLDEALPEDESPVGDDQALADEWAKALADDEGDAMQKEKQQTAFSQSASDAQFKDLTEDAKTPRPDDHKRELDFILDIPLDVSAELGRTRLLINELLQLGQGSVIELNKLAGEPLEIYVNGKLVARGEAVVINEKFGVRLTDIISPIERVKQLG